MTKLSNIGPRLGEGIYTLPDIGHILGMPYHRIHRWIKDYWDTRLATDLDETYSWFDGKSRAIGFHTLIELVVFSQLSEVGVRSRAILKAHSELSNEFDTPFPFATSSVINNMFTDGIKIYFKRNNHEIHSLDGKKQLNLEFIQEFFKNIEFGEGGLASKYWPMGKNRKIVVDPSHQCGQPVISGTNIMPDALYRMFLAGDKPEFIAFVYDLDETDVNDALEFCQKAAA